MKKIITVIILLIILSYHSVGITYGEINSFSISVIYPVKISTVSIYSNGVSNTFITTKENLSLLGKTETIVVYKSYLFGIIKIADRFIDGDSLEEVEKIQG